MIIAVPMVQGSLSMHFGHCQYFRLFEVDEKKSIVKVEDKTPPPHEPGVYPQWLSEQNASIIITGGMGMKAQQLFSNYGIKVVSGAPAGEAEDIVKAWLLGTLATGANACDH